MPALLPGTLTRPGMTSRAPVGRRGSVAPVAVARPRSGRPAPPTAIAPPAEATSLVFSEGSATPVGGDAPASVGSAGLSYSEQYDSLWATGEPLDVKRPIPKPSRAAQATLPGAKRVPWSDVFTVAKTRAWLGRAWASTDKTYVAFMLAMHGLALLAPLTFSWKMVGLFFATYFVTGCLGITLSFHRQLSHRAFATPKWLEYALAYCGVLAVQGDPIEWVSSHRFHHLHCDTPLDPHSPYEGFWWSHAGWLLDHDATMVRVGARGNTGDMDTQPFYTWITRTYPWHVAAQFALIFALGGLPAVVWGGALRVCWVYHVTWFVNSVCHVWGKQTYDAGDLSRNNWWVGLLAFGEGWHNNHHAFEFSARHGLEWWQVDMTWGVVSVLRALGLAKNVKLPSEKQKARMRIVPGMAPVGA